MSFENAMARLEEIVKLLETGKPDLETVVAAFSGRGRTGGILPYGAGKSQASDRGALGTKGRGERWNLAKARKRYGALIEDALGRRHRLSGSYSAD